jgi:hypothetical protein
MVERSNSELFDHTAFFVFLGLDPTHMAEQAFLAWFVSQGGTISPKFGLHDFGPQGMGRGAIALEDIEVRKKRDTTTTAFFHIDTVCIPE